REIQSPLRLLLRNNPNFVVRFVPFVANVIDPLFSLWRRVAFAVEIIDILFEALIRLCSEIHCNMHQNLATQHRGRGKCAVARAVSRFVVQQCDVLIRDAFDCLAVAGLGIDLVGAFKICRASAVRADNNSCCDSAMAREPPDTELPGGTLAAGSALVRKTSNVVYMLPSMRHVFLKE